jgi:hypothetical protein
MVVLASDRRMALCSLHTPYDGPKRATGAGPPQERTKGHTKAKVTRAKRCWGGEGEEGEWE